MFCHAVHQKFILYTVLLRLLIVIVAALGLCILQLKAL
jgi:hypothetical protein